MNDSARESYLAAQVTTAPPQRLHLMLVDAALQNCEKARQHWRAGENDWACESLLRAQEIVGEMMAGLNRDVAPELVAQVAGLYAFVFRALREANRTRDEQKLAGAVRVLEIERQTWQELCEQLAGAAKSPRAPAAAPMDVPFAAPMDFPSAAPLPADYAGGFSLDA